MLTLLLMAAATAGAQATPPQGPQSSAQKPGSTLRSTSTEDCTLGEVRPMLKDARGSKVERTQKGPREVVERTRLSPATTVEVVQGGCAHYGVRFLFTTERTSAVRGATSGQSLPGEALELLTALKQRTSSPVVADTAEILAALKNEPYREGEPLQHRAHPDITLYITARDKQTTREVEVTYSFVL